jgi:hypothetical protein
LIGRSANPGRTAAKKSRTGSFHLRQLSTTEKIAATFGPGCGLPMHISASITGSTSTVVKTAPSGHYFRSMTLEESNTMKVFGVQSGS